MVGRYYHPTVAMSSRSNSDVTKRGGSATRPEKNTPKIAGNTGGGPGSGGGGSGGGGMTPTPIRRNNSRSKVTYSDLQEATSPTRAVLSSKQPGPSLCSLVDAEYIPLAVDLCYWVAEQTNACIEIDQFISCLQDGIVLCRLVNVMNKHKANKEGEPFKLVHFRENIGNSVFFSRINIETFIRWSKLFGVEESSLSTVADLIDLKDVMQALANVMGTGRRCAELGLPHPRIVALENEHGMRYEEIVALFNPDIGALSGPEADAKAALIKLINSRGLGAMRSDATLIEQLGTWKKRISGRWSGSEADPLPEPEPPAPTPPPPKPETPEPDPLEPKLGPWEKEEEAYLIEMYKQQILEHGDGHIDFKGLSQLYSERHPLRSARQCWDKMYQLIDRYHVDTNANKLFKRKLCSGPHHDQLHVCLGDIDISKHIDAVYTGMAHPKAPAVPTYVACEDNEREELERTGKEEIAEQTKLLRKIEEHLRIMREATEKNSATNSALLVLLTHVLKGEREAEGSADCAETIVNGENGNETIGSFKSSLSEFEMFEQRNEC